MRLIYWRSMKSWQRLKEHRELEPSEYVEPSDTASADNLNVVFVSHRWITSHHPDPNGQQLKELRRRIATLSEQDTTFNNCLVFYDYCSMLQQPRTSEENATFERELTSLRTLIGSANRVIILSEGYHDYKNRGWCFFEAIVSEGNKHFFNDQTQIKEDLNFLRYLMAEEEDLIQVGARQQITGFDFSYKQDTTEIELIVCSFQHLNNCKCTHKEDLILLKSQLAGYFNSRRMSSFGRLITGINKFFDVEFMILAMGGDGPVTCKPYFAEPELVRLPPLTNRPLDSLMKGGTPDSVFALPPAKYSDLVEVHPSQCVPVLRLVLPDLDDHGAFLHSVRANKDWEQYLVPAVGLGMTEDCFPSVEHVLHTVLEIPPGIATAKECLYMFLRTE